MMVRLTTIRTSVISIIVEIERQLEEARDHAAMFVKISQTTKKQFVALAIVGSRYAQTTKTYSIHLNTSK